MAKDYSMKLSVKRKFWFVGTFMTFYVFIWCASWFISQERFNRWVSQFSEWLVERAFKIKVEEV